MKTIKIYYDNQNDVLTFTKHRHIVAGPVAKVSIPEGTRRDGDCVVLPDHPTTVFKNRRVTPLELYIRANNNWGEGLCIAETEIHGMHTFSMYGKNGKCSHGEIYPCDKCKASRKALEESMKPLKQAVS